jgi:hypothetical protein
VKFARQAAERVDAKKHRMVARIESALTEYEARLGTP